MLLYMTCKDRPNLFLRIRIKLYRFISPDDKTFGVEQVNHSINELAELQIRQLLFE